MIVMALKMLVGDRAKYIGIIMGLAFASLLITQQASIFVGIMARTFGFISDTGQPDVWVMDPKVQYVDDVKPLSDTELFRVRSVPGVAWAVPMFKGNLKARLPSGNFQNVVVIGLDDTTMIGGPPDMVEGRLADLRRSDGIIVDLDGARKKLVQPGPHGERIPLRMGETIELNDRRAVVVGICKVSRTLLAQPMIYTTYTRALQFAPRERKLLSFVLVKTRPGIPAKDLAGRITRRTGLAAYTNYEFKMMSVNYFMKYTGIPVNFGMTAILGFIVGMAVAGQTFYNFTYDHLPHMAALKAMGASNLALLRMLMVQAMVVGLIGYGLGVGAAAWFGYATRDTELAFLLLWQQLAISAGAVLLICFFSAIISAIKVFRAEPAMVFRD